MIQITPVLYRYNRNKYPKTMSRVNMTQPEDTFIKSPSFKGAEYNKVAPFLLDGISYTEKNLKKFNQIIESIDFKNRTDTLLKALRENVLHALRHRNYIEKDTTFAVDFMLRTGDIKNLQEMCGTNLDAVFEALPKIKFSDETKPNVLSLLKDVTKTRYYADTIPYVMYDDAIENDNVPLLKTLIKDFNWGLFKRHDFNGRAFECNELQIIRRGQSSTNPQIRELFNGKFLYNLITQYSDNTYNIVRDCLGSMPDFITLYVNEAPDKIARLKNAKDVADAILYTDSCYFNYDEAKYLSELPFTKVEKNALNDDYYYGTKKEQIQKAIKMRIEKIIQRNGIETPEQLLACMNDRIMNSDLLEFNYQGFTLLDKIVEMPVTEDSKPYISKIIEKLSETNIFPDNNTYRRAAIKAARQGNVELLKFFESKNIHFANLINEPLSRFPQNVREILENAKINDTDLLEYAKFPQYIDSYLKLHPKTDINSKTPGGDSLLTMALKLKSLETLETLAKRDDVDWNIVNNDGDNILMQLLDFWGRDYYDRNESHDLVFKKKVIKLLRELPEGKFDINYVNNECSSKYKNPHTALSKLFYYYKQERLLLDDILKFKNIDTNLDPTNGRSLLLKVVNDSYYFTKLFLHPNTDTTLIKAEDIEQLKKNGISIDPSIFSFLEEQENKAFANVMLKRYEENGMFKSEEIKNFVSSKSFASVCDMKFNIFGENIAHLLTDIFPDMTNPKELMLVYDIVRKLSECKFDFQMKDELGRTPYEKAIEGGNTVIADLLKNYQ